MPTSNKELKNEITEWYKTLNPRTVLDVGTGEGTYCTLLKHLNNSIWIGIEAWAPYIKKFDLDSKYNMMIVSDIKYLSFGSLPFHELDLLIIGDCLEHLEKGIAVSLINKFKSYAKNIFISIPHGDCPQGSLDGNWFEKHRSTWDHEELKNILLESGYLIDNLKGEILSAYWWKR